MSLLNQETDLRQEKFELWKLLDCTRHAIISARELELREYGISPEQAAILLRIHELNNKATQKQISHIIFRKANTVSVAVKRMEKQGLVKRARKKNQNNSIYLSLTRKGEAIYRKTLERKTIDDILSTISPDQSQQLKSSLKTLFNAAVNEIARSKKDAFLENVFKQGI
jgi:DNA-binding MarR family transcriptional regulator